jgi:hypothetical protein
MEQEILCPVRPRHLAERANIRITVAFKRPDDEWSTAEHHWRSPEDLAACVCNCLDWCRMQRESRNWSWCSVTVAYEV